MTRFGAVDVGTNTVRLLVADVSAGDLVDVERGLEITRLGRGVDATRRLTTEAVERTAAVAARFVERARQLGVDSVRVAGTSALRDARNPEDFTAAVRQRCGAEVEILAGAQEGRLAFLGATTGLEGGPYLVCDVGGGSTEFVRGTGVVEAVWSADVGSVRLRERYLTSDPPTPGEIAGARTAVRDQLVVVERDVGLVGDERLIGVAGTITTLGALVLGLKVYDAAKVHRSVLRREDVLEWSGRLLAMTVDEVKALPSMDPRRADVVASGVLILAEVVRRWEYDEVLVSERDILHGLIWDLVRGPSAGAGSIPYEVFDT